MDRGTPKIPQGAMSNFFKAELKDRFLEYALECGEFFEVRILYDEFLRPNYDLGYVEGLVWEILEYDPGLLDIKSGHGRELFMLSPTEATEDFMENGGFMDLYVKEEEKWDAFLGHISNTRIPSKPLAKGSGASSLKKEKSMLYALISAVALSFLFTVFSIFKQTFLEPKYVPVDEFERKLEILQQQYIQENQRLQFKLEQSRMDLDSLGG